MENRNIILKEDVIDGISPWYWDARDTHGWNAILEDWNNGLKDNIINNVLIKGTVVQAGGMLGMYPRLLAEIFDNVITFEPNYANYEILLLNCKDKSNIISNNFGLSDTVGQLPMISLAEDNLGMKLIPNDVIPVNGYENTLEQITVITIDSLKLDNCDLLLLDIERHEFQALCGAVETINKFKPTIIIENNEEDRPKIMNLLRSLGYLAVNYFNNDVVYMHNSKVENQPVLEKKKILIAYPTRKDVEPESMLSVHRLIIPEGYTTWLDMFYGYNIDQVRNLIADFAKNNQFDYLLCVDSDMVLESDTLIKLLEQDKDIIGGVYRQRREDVVIPEVYFSLPNGGSRNCGLEELNTAPDLFAVDSIGFGCVLIKKHVLTTMDYPHFYYKHSIDFKDTVSEDTYFCRKARAYGFETYCLNTVRPGHITKVVLTIPPRNNVTHTK